MTVTIYHNPKCGTSRNVLEMIRARGIEPTVVEYLKTGWTPALIKDLGRETGLGVKGLMRVRGTPAEELGLTAEGVDEATVISAMVEHPILIERPIVTTPKGAVLARPAEKVETVL